MTSHDDADPEDDGLKSLRAVWLSLPDEDPPERGLADLMSAARVKANEMAEAAQPSWWERLVAVLRRPQVLALATILILIGGGVIISQKREKLEAPAATQAEPQSLELAPARERAADQGEADKAQGAAPGADLAAPVAPSAPAVGGASPVAEPGPAEQDSIVKAEAKPVAPKRKAPASPPPQSVTTPAKTTKPRSKASGKFDSGGATGGMPADDSKLLFDEAADAPADTATATPPAPTVKQLHAQARDAAARNDCEAVRMLAKKIARQDAPYYRASIATDQALASCLN